MPAGISVHQREYSPETLVHRHPYAQVVLPEQGRLDLLIGGQHGAVKQAEYAVVAPDAEHICWTDRPTRCLVVDLPEPMLAGLSAGRSGWNDLPFRRFDARVRALANLLRMESTAGGFDDPLVAESLGRYTATAFASPELARSQSAASGPSGRFLARRVRAYLDEHYREELSLTGVAESVGASVAHVQRAFRAETGVSVVTYVQDRRLDVAAELLRTTDLSVSEVALRAGFGSASYLARLFARRYHLSPSQYRAIR